MSDEASKPAEVDEKKRASEALRKLLDDAAWDIVMRVEQLVDERVRQVMVVDDIDKKLRIDRTAKLNLGYRALQNRLSDALVEMLRRFSWRARGTAATAKANAREDDA